MRKKSRKQYGVFEQQKIIWLKNKAVDRQEKKLTEKKFMTQQMYQDMICCCVFQFQLNQGSCAAIKQSGICPTL